MYLYSFEDEIENDEKPLTFILILNESNYSFIYFVSVESIVLLIH